MNFIYPCIYHLDEEGGYWCEFPDFSCCVSQGDDLDELLYNSKEVLEGMLLSLIERGETIPTPSDIRSFKCDENTFTSYVKSDIPKNSKLIKKTLTIPEWVNSVGIARGVNFSKMLTTAMLREVKGLNKEV